MHGIKRNRLDLSFNQDFLAMLLIIWLKTCHFSVPEELYELYEWCNGSSEDSDAIAFHQQYLLSS
jgi:hypothetical protein